VGKKVSRLVSIPESEVKVLNKLTSDKTIISLLSLVHDRRFNVLSAIVRALCWCYEDEYCRKYLYETIRLAIVRKTRVTAFIEEKSLEESQKRLREIEEQVRKAKEMGII